MEDSTRWTVKVSKETDISLRSYLARQGMKKGDLSKFVENAVRKEVFAKTIAAIKRRNADVPDKELEAIIDEAVAAVRAERRRKLARK
jgi:hypothetical protein